MTIETKKLHPKLFWFSHFGKLTKSIISSYPQGRMKAVWFVLNLYLLYGTNKANPLGNVLSRLTDISEDTVSVEPGHLLDINICKRIGLGGNETLAVFVSFCFEVTLQSFCQFRYEEDFVNLTINTDWQKY